MPFRFSLETLLKYREALEQRELLALQKAQQEVLAIESQISEAAQQQAMLAENRQLHLRHGMKANELQAEVENELRLDRRRIELAQTRHQLIVKREERLVAYREILRKREVLEKLRSRKLAEYTREQIQAEQARIDDLFLARRKRDR